MKKYLIIFTIILLVLLQTIVFAQSFRDKVILSPDIKILWNLQRNFEEIIRFVKFTRLMRIEYSLDLIDRRIGEIEVLTDKNETDIIISVGNEYEKEVDRLKAELNETVISKDKKTNFIKRLQNQIKALSDIFEKIPEVARSRIFDTIKKSSQCINIIIKK